VIPLYRRLLALGRAEIPGGPFSPEAERWLSQDAGALALADEMNRLSPVERLLTALRGVALERDAAAEEAVDVEFVATLPGYLSSVARTTEATIAALLTCARHQVIVVGYELTEASFVRGLHEVARRGVEVICITDRRSGHGRRLLNSWPPEALPARVFQEKANEISDKSKMHGKALLVDGESLLVSSANFTWLGMNANIELGVLLRGPRVRTARTLFEELLIHSRLLERVPLSD
jgi:phosphatidylserine/phosphatidylglycerophosphate/cardiolipin synthase-like enzyme